tara:strand:- start:122 stop:295 length:174 start_codon:yes stop_codon:yes gene_type:complete
MSLLIDTHSFPSKALPSEDKNLARPNIRFGYDVFHEPKELINFFGKVDAVFRLASES